MNIIKALLYSKLSSPSPKQPSLCQTRRWLEKGDFYFKQIYILKNCFNKIWVNQNFFKICYEYIKNNSYINLDGEIHIKIVWSCSNAVKTHNINIFHKVLTTGRPVAKSLIEYNNNKLEVNDEEEKEPIDIELTEQKTDHYNDENAIEFKWWDVQE